jgi:hypothetical protein
VQNLKFIKNTLFDISAVDCRDCNPGTLFQNRDYGAERPQNRDPGARTGTHSRMKNLFFVEKCPEHNCFRTKNMRYYTLLEIVKFPLTIFFKTLINRFNCVTLALFSNFRTKMLLNLSIRHYFFHKLTSIRLNWSRWIRKSFSPICFPPYLICWNLEINIENPTNLNKIWPIWAKFAQFFDRKLNLTNLDMWKWLLNYYNKLFSFQLALTLTFIYSNLGQNHFSWNKTIKITKKH